MSRRDWLLLLLAYEGAPDGLHPVRVQTSVFLLAHDDQLGLDAGEAYEFVPYNYGPMSKQVYADLDQLAGEGLIRRVPVQGQSWTLFQTTPKGLEVAQRLVDAMAAGEIPVARRLFEIKQLVVGLTFAQLVEYVYDRYPVFETRSIFRSRSSSVARSLFPWGHSSSAMGHGRSSKAGSSC
jgi:hypothetical protein